MFSIFFVIEPYIRVATEDQGFGLEVVYPYAEYRIIILFKRYENNIDFPLSQFQIIRDKVLRKSKFIIY